MNKYFVCYTVTGTIPKKCLDLNYKENINISSNYWFLAKSLNEDAINKAKKEIFDCIQKGSPEYSFAPVVFTFITKLDE